MNSSRQHNLLLTLLAVLVAVVPRGAAAGRSQLTINEIASERAGGAMV